MQKRVCRRSPWLLTWSVLLGAILAFAGCSLTKHFRSARSELLRKPPYYIGGRHAVEPPIGILPVTLDRRFQRDFLRQDLYDEMRFFAAKANRFLKDRAGDELVLLPPIDRPIEDAPDVYVGNPLAEEAPDPMTWEEEMQHHDSMPGAPFTVVYALSPALKWKEQLRRFGEKYGVQHVVFIALGVSEYFPVQIDWKGRKAIYLGTGYAQKLSWLTSLEDPIEVLHFTGALLDTSGKVLRAGAEGIHASPASFWESVLGLKRVHDDQEIRNIFRLRRKDLPGEPLAWQVALQNLLIQLTGGRRPILP